MTEPQSVEPIITDWSCGQCGATVRSDLMGKHFDWHAETEQSGAGFAQRVAAAQRALAMRNRFPMRPTGG